MTIIRNAVIGLVSVALVLVLGTILYFAFADFNAWRTDIEESVADATGFALAFNGEFDLQAGSELVLTATDIDVSNPAYPENPGLVTIDRLLVAVGTLSLVRGPLDIRRLEIEGFDATLVEDTGGGANWHAAGPQADPDEADRSAGNFVIVRQLDLRDVAIRHRRGGEEPVSLRLDRFIAERRERGDTQYGFEGEAAAGKLVTTIRGTGLIGTGGRRIEFGGTALTVANAALTHDGWIEFGRAGPRSEFVLTAEGASLAAVGVAFGNDDWPGLPFDLSVTAAAVSGGAEFHDLRAHLGDGELTASAALDWTGQRPSLRINANSPLLDLRGDGAAEAADTDGEDTGRVFSDEPLALSGLDSLDVDAEVFIGRIRLPANELADFNARVVLRDGALSIGPAGFSSGGGQLTGRLDLAPVDGTHALDLELDLADFRPGMLAGDGLNPATVPPLNMEVAIAGRGASLHEIMQGASGSVTGTQGSGRIDLQAAGFLFSDLVTSVFRALNPLAEREAVTNLECGIYDIQIAGGKATIRQLALQSDRLAIVGSGGVDLGAETIDLTLRTRTREGIGVSLGGVANSFLKVGGALAAPSIGVDAAGSVATTGAAMATGGLSVLAKGLWDRLAAEADLCSTFGDRSAEDPAGE